MPTTPTNPDDHIRRVSNAEWEHLRKETRRHLDALKEFEPDDTGQSTPKE